MTTIASLTSQTTVEGLVTALGVDSADASEKLVAVLVFSQLKTAAALTSIANTLNAQKADAAKVATGVADMAQAARKDAGLP